MKYNRIKEGKFIARPNRFIAEVEIDGRAEICHVKNTGRCKELLVRGAKVYVEESSNPERKTRFDLISVYKGDTLINMDSQAPNKVFSEWATKTDYFGEITLIKPECKYKNSRFDFYIETEKRKIFVEVKGVTLENDGVVSFPDAPTQRGVKHIRELQEAIKDGYEAYVFFIVQMSGVRYFVPNGENDPGFAQALENASENGVIVKALECEVTKNSLTATEYVQVHGIAD